MADADDGFSWTRDIIQQKNIEYTDLPYQDALCSGEASTTSDID